MKFQFAQGTFKPDAQFQLKEAVLSWDGDSSVGLFPSTISLKDLNFYMENDDVKRFGDVCDSLMEIITGEPCSKVHLIDYDNVTWFIHEDEIIHLHNPLKEETP
jgi:hypothetical protein